MERAWVKNTDSFPFLSAFPLLLFSAFLRHLSRFLLLGAGTESLGGLLPFLLFLHAFLMHHFLGLLRSTFARRATRTGSAGSTLSEAERRIGEKKHGC
jgi:hypothetical protein